jgi:hypothetical protein
MNKKYNVLKTTTDNRTYRRALLEVVSDNELLCHYCPPHKGCNWFKKDKRMRNWKEYRKTQYKPQ